MNYQRKLQRNVFRKLYGNKGLRARWVQFQQKKYSYKKHVKILSENRVLKGIKRIFKTLKNKLARKRRGPNVTT